MNWSKLLTKEITLKRVSLKLPLKIQVYFLKLLHELLREGFSFSQSIQFIRLLLPKYSQSLDYIENALLQGFTFESTLSTLGFSISAISQLFYAQRQGRLIEGLELVSDHLKTKISYRQKIIKALVYPVVLSFALIILLMGMRAFLLPHVKSFITEEIYYNNRMVRVLLTFFTYLPQIFTLLIGFILLIYGFFELYLMKLPLLRRYQMYLKLPIIRHWIRYYSTYKLARQLGDFYNSGYSILSIVETLQNYPIDPFLTAISEVFHDGFNRGKELSEMIQSIQLFTEAFPLIIQQGEATSQLAQKCTLYADKLFHDLLTDITKKIGYIQPILFIVIAIFVMAMYLMMMLPMLTMEGF